MPLTSVNFAAYPANTDKCSICLEPTDQDPASLAKTNLPALGHAKAAEDARHLMHRHCLNNWISECRTKEQPPRCPICRSAINLHSLKPPLLERAAPYLHAAAKTLAWSTALVTLIATDKGRSTTLEVLQSRWMQGALATASLVSFPSVQAYFPYSTAVLRGTSYALATTVGAGIGAINNPASPFKESISTVAGASCLMGTACALLTKKKAAAVATQALVMGGLSILVYGIATTWNEKSSLQERVDSSLASAAVGTIAVTVVEKFATPIVSGIINGIRYLWRREPNIVISAPHTWTRPS